jgi:putative FmdB family regulatory protein
MPTYEYRCPEGHAFEKFQKMSDKPQAKCPVCGKAATRKISGGAGLVFKGTGFYITDYGKDGKGPRKDPSEKAGGGEAKEAKPAGESKSASDSKSEAKPAAGSESKAGKQQPSKSRGKASSE